jgi:mitogen-activated protein kinase 1/3
MMWWSVGAVSSARDLKTGQLVAVKKIENIFEHRSLAKRTLRELKLSRYFYHENVRRALSRALPLSAPPLPPAVIM